MGDPKRIKKKYATPMHPWVKTEIEQARVIKQEYGLKTRKEILIANSFLKKYKDIAKRLIAIKTAQAEKEKEQILSKLRRLGLLQASDDLDSILGLELKNILDRRLQSIVYQKGLAQTMKQARQFIVHRHVRIADKEITSPGYILSLEEETQIVFKPTSTLADEMHPERVATNKTPEEVKKEEPAATEAKAVTKE